MLVALLHGLVLGFVGGIPVGPVNAAVIDTALRKCVRRAIAIGVGGAFVDFVYSQVATAVIAPLMERFPGLSTLLLGVGGIVLVIFGLMSILAPPMPDQAGPARPVVAKALVAAFFTGVLITLANPAALVSWVLLAGALLNHLSAFHAFVAGLGIFVGTTVWFVLIAWLASKGRVRLGQRARLITRGVGALLVVYGIFLVAKASVNVWAHALG
jgi:threonine/homoserine/homoserine lactone efflux protein